ncbi:MAG: hypothetical protein CMH99_04645, partial [Oceanospirillaceae bacterium]|nr:hypothetical protein [Oceanospirillaceae bacterium]
SAPRLFSLHRDYSLSTATILSAPRLFSQHRDYSLCTAPYQQTFYAHKSSPKIFSILPLESAFSAPILLIRKALIRLKNSLQPLPKIVAVRFINLLLMFSQEDVL